MRTVFPAVLAAILTACTQAQDNPAASSGDGPPVPIAADAGGQPAFDAIRADETIRFLGTEPFWDGTIRAGQMTYRTPENEAGETIAVSRFAGNNGLGFSGTRDGKPVDLTVTPGECSDGMSDRIFPFTVTLKLGDEQRNGCAWTDRRPYKGPAAP